MLRSARRSTQCAFHTAMILGVVSSGSVAGDSNRQEQEYDFFGVTEGLAI